MIVRNGDELVFECDACAKPVVGEDGYVHVSMSDIAAYEEAMAAWKSEDPGNATLAAIRKMPRRVEWQVHHEACDPQPNSGDYFFGVERADSWAKLTHWTGHLMATKSWQASTNWSAVLVEIGEDA